ncbi:hypothetical protein [uncultured Mediterranean phage uvMED]|jgi:hypothetical protein|nr:hypothetical protein [uncultured Mediterranean phage uvMED]
MDFFNDVDVYDSTPEDDKKFMEERIIVLLEYLANSRNEVTMLKGENSYLKQKLEQNDIKY